MVLHDAAVAEGPFSEGLCRFGSEMEEGEPMIPNDLKLHFSRLAAVWEVGLISRVAFYNYIVCWGGV